MKQLLTAMIDGLFHRDRHTVKIDFTKTAPVRIPVNNAERRLDHFLVGPQCDENIPEQYETGEWRAGL